MSYLDRYREIVDDWDAFAAAIERPLPTTVWANPLKISPDALEARLRADGVAVTNVPWRPGTYRLDEANSPGRRLEFMAGLYQVQEEAALPAVDLMKAQPGERVLDMCAAPGNKSAQLAVAMEGRGMVVANDKSYGRLRAVRAVLDRLGLVNVAVTNHDATRFPDLGAFDRVLADVPCSCEGTLRKNPNAIEIAASSNVHEIAGLQASILRRSLRLCREGGLVVYATCTFAPEENEGVVQRILDEFGDTIELERAQIEGFVSSPGLTEWNGDAFDPRLERCMRVWPHHNDTGGFFIACIRRVNT